MAYRKGIVGCGAGERSGIVAGLFTRVRFPYAICSRNSVGHELQPLPDLETASKRHSSSYAL